MRWTQKFSILKMSSTSSDISYVDVDEPEARLTSRDKASGVCHGREGFHDDDDDHHQHHHHRTEHHGPDRWSFDTEELVRSANLILSGLGGKDDGVLVEGVGDGRGGDLAEQQLDDGRSAHQCQSDGVGVASTTRGGGPLAVDHGYDASSYAMLTHAELVRLRQQQAAASLQRQTQLRQFVKDNFAETIETIDTVRDVVVGVKGVTGEGWKDGKGEAGSYQALASAIVELDEEAEEAFRGYVERVGLSENLNTVVQLFGAYDGLIVLPGLLRGRVDVGDWEGFVRGCEKAVSEIRGMATRGVGGGGSGGNGGSGGDHSSVEQVRSEGSTWGESNGEIWVKLEEEVVKAAERGAGLLLGVLKGLGGRESLAERDPRRQMVMCMENIQRGADAACYLERLKRLDGLSLANLRHVDVLGAFVEGQVAGVVGLLSKQMDAYRRPVGDVVAVVSGMSRFAVAWCRGYQEMCGRMEGMRRRNAANAPFAETLIESEGRGETSTPRRVFSGYVEMVKECVGRALTSSGDASAGSDHGASDAAFAPSSYASSSSSSSSSALQLVDGLMRIVRESEQVMEVLSDELGSWYVDEEGSGVYAWSSTNRKGEKGGKPAKSPRKDNTSLRGALATAAIAAGTQSSAAIAVPLTPQIRDLFSHVIEHMLYVMEEYLRVRIAPNVFLLRSSIAGDNRSIPRNQVQSTHINPGFIPRSNMALLRTSIDEVMRSMSRLVKHARLIHAPVGFKANAFLKTVSAACSASIVQYVLSLPLASTTEDREDVNHVDEFVLLAACKTLEEIKTSVLPEIITTHSSVLHLGNATATENSNAFKWCCTQFEDSQELLMKRWVEIKLQKLEPVMSTILDVPSVVPAAEGMPGDTAGDNRDEHQPQTAVLELMTTLKAYDADIIAMTPLLRDEVVGEMYLAVVEGLRDLVTSDVFAGAGTEARLQTWADAKAMETWLVAELGRDEADAVLMCREVLATFGLAL